ncbi:MAG: ferredoxin [Gammaproteobacteria bacterium]|nr:ferredoxin [Gammaproteobacteria bacterium]
MNSETTSRQGEPAEPVALLRRFHYGEPAASASTQVPPGSILPALLHPYRDAAAIRYQYPLYLVPPGDEPAEVLAKALTEHFADALAGFAPGEDDARILKDNLPWLERFLRQRLDGPDPVAAPALFDEAADALQTQLNLSESARETLDAQLASLRAAIADGSQFLGYGPDAPLHLLLHATRHRDERRRAELHREVDGRARKLAALLQVEAARDPSRKGNGTDVTAQHLDTSKLSSLMASKEKGSVAMSEERRARIEQALAMLQSWQDEPVLLRCVGSIDNPWFARHPAVDVVASDDPCTAAGELFEREAGRFAQLFAALRVAALEAEDKYEAAIHDSWFGEFDWQAFSDEELQHVTRVVAIVAADQLAGDGLPSFSRLLGSRKPVHVISWIRAYDNPGVAAGEGPFDGYRFELAYFGVGHRHAVVSQASAARHDDLLAGFLAALDGNRTSLHLVNRGTQTKAGKPVLEPWFVASAALESRAHPFVLVNPCGGDRAAERISFDGNPQPENDWPVETLVFDDAEGESKEMKVAFTFADYALLMPALREHFRVVPAGCESPDFVSVADYLGGEDEALDRRVPFVWGIDENGDLLRLVISRALIFACRDRLNYWHALQELAGIHNFYVEEAVERVIETARVAAEAERDELLKAHAEELEEARSEAAGEAMGQLVDVLMGADLSSMVTESAPAAIPAAEEAPADAEPAAEAEPEPAAADEEEDDVSFDEPWLDTAACTTCDDCMGINKMMFAYNDDKQAYLKDPQAGPYADLVKAAEICPANCIHPGKPLDPGEPNLEELMARAAPFN